MILNLQKKGDLSMSTIVTAAVALLVLIIISAIVAGRLGVFGQAVSHCELNDNAICSPIRCPDRLDTFRTTLHGSKCFVGEGRNRMIDETQHCCIAAGS